MQGKIILKKTLFIGCFLTVADLQISPKVIGFNANKYTQNVISRKTADEKLSTCIHCIG